MGAARIDARVFPKRAEDTPPMPQDNRNDPVRWLNGLRRVARGPLVIATALPLLSGLLLLGQAWCLAAILGAAIVDKAALPTLLPLIAGFGGLMAVRIGLGAFAERAGGIAGEAIKLAVRQTIFAELIRRRRPTDLAASSSGAIASVMIEQVEGLDGYFSRYLPAMAQASLLPLVFAVVLLPVDWVAGLVFLLTAPLIPLFMALVGWGAEAASNRQATAMLRLAGRFGDRLRGLTTLKLFGRAEAETAAMVSASEDLRQRTLGVLRIAFLSSAVLEFFAALGVAGVALYVGLSFLGLVHLRLAPLSLEAGLFLLLMAPEIYQPLRLLAAHYHDRAAAKAAVAALAQTLGTLPQLAPDLPRDLPVPAQARAPAGIELMDLSLRTPDGGRRVLDGVDLSVRAGQHVALLGESGSGKSTLLEALARLRSYEGEIRLGAEDLRQVNESALRRRLAFLPQKPQLFHDTIAANIALGAPWATRQDIEAAARRACVTEFARLLPEGLDTGLGDGGLGLSGGEIQRIALARIYLRDPDVIVLDEPTAHLDAATESQVLDGLLDFANGRTLVVATHAAAVAARIETVYRLVGQSLLPAPRVGRPPARHRIEGAA